MSRLSCSGSEVKAETTVRNEMHYVCCPNNYTLLNFTLFLRRRPLFYLVNLVIPTFIITLIAITGFFTTSSTTGVREEKISLCITNATFDVHLNVDGFGSDAINQHFYTIDK
ncbi:hypothetical protein COOONC_04625 [Cooperia oncophora]